MKLPLKQEQCGGRGEREGTMGGAQGPQEGEPCQGPGAGRDTGRRVQGAQQATSGSGMSDCSHEREGKTDDFEVSSFYGGSRQEIVCFDEKSQAAVGSKTNFLIYLLGSVT